MESNDNDNGKLSFELNLLFEGHKQPTEAFRELGNIFQTLYDFDKWILSHVAKDASVFYSLENLEYSSIKTKIAQLLRAIPDDAIKNLELKSLIGNLLLKVKYLFLKMLEQNQTIDSKQILETLTTEINSEIKQIEKVSTEIILPEVNIYILLNNIETATKIINSLQKNEAIEYKSKYGTVKISNGCFLNKSKIIQELGATTITNESTEILKIKKIDMLSNEARWDFKRDAQTIQAKILDTAWLDDYHQRKIILKPEDALKVTMKTFYTYTSNNEHTKIQFEILKVLGVITPEQDNPPTPNLFS